ncbi:MAG: Na(+)-translocating NADH-quinone reductase subunit A [Thiohalobacterales bacterium]
MRFTIKQGLDIPIDGKPEQRIHDAPPVTRVALVGADYHSRKRLPTMLVQEGDRVKLGQPVARGKALTDVVATAPGSGIVEKINRGERRFLQSIVIRLEGNDEETFNAYKVADLAGLNRKQIVENLIVSGLWLALRTRPYSLIADPDTEPDAIFVTAIDTHPLAADPAVIIGEAQQDWLNGLALLSKLTDGKVHVCKAPGAGIPVCEDPSVVETEFQGPHPAGLVGTHIHLLAPVSAEHSIWHVGYQDAIAMGRLFTTGKLPIERIVALCGPAISNPRLVRTRLGASTTELVGNDLRGNDCRVVSGSILSGRRAVEWAAYLGRFHNQVTVLAEGRKRIFLRWLRLGSDFYSSTPIYLGGAGKRRSFPLTTSENGSPRAMVPIGSYERVMPLDILPTQLLRSLVVRDTETAQLLGCLELDEEDLALCSFVCPGKHDFGPILRENLEKIMKEG